MDEILKLHTATDDDAGARLDKWMTTWADLSRARCKALILEGAARIDGDILRDPTAKVRAGAEYALHVPPPRDDIPKPQDIPLSVVYEDDDLIVVDKAAGMTVHPAVGNWSGTLVNALLFHCKGSLSGIGGVARPGIVHRIDKDTSGLLVVAKHDKAHQRLSKQFAKHSVERSYVCYTRTAPRPRAGRVETRLARSPGDRKKMGVVKGTDGDIEASEHGKHAITNYKFLAGYGQQDKAAIGTPRYAKIECRLETGRTHQIRVHMAHIGCPLLGDPTYGKQRAFNTAKSDAELALKAALSTFKRQALHAQTLGFIHPMTKEPMQFESALPPDLQALEDALLAI